MPHISFEAPRMNDNMKKELIQQVSALSAEITGIPESAFIVSIHELPEENIGVGGRTLKEVKSNG